MGSLSSLISDAFTIYSSAYSKIAEIGVEVVDLEGSPRQPRKINQLIESTNLYYTISPSIELNDDGDEIIGVNGDVATINNLLLKLKRAVGLYKLPAFPTPLTSFSFNLSDGGINVGPGQLGDLITNNGSDWTILNMGAPGTVPVATVNGIQWQSVVGNGIPSGGTTNQYLRKNSNTSYDVVWDTLTVSKITDLTASASELNILAGVTGVDATKINFLQNVNADIQGQFTGKLSTTLTNGNFLVGNASDAATSVTPTGDVTFNNLGVFAIAAGAIVNADIHAGAAIARTKIAGGSNYRLVINGAAGAMDEASLLTADRVLVSDTNGIPTASGISTTTIAFMDATSSVQGQLNARLEVNLTSPAQGNMLYYNGTDWINFAVGTNGQLLSSNGTIPVWVSDPPTGLPSGGAAGEFLIKDSVTDYDASWHMMVMADITDVSTTFTELNLLSGLTVNASLINLLTDADSNIQDQIDTKLNKTLNVNHIFVGNSSNIAVPFATGTNGYVLTSVSGVPDWQPVSAGTPPGSDTQVIFNDGGAFGTDAGMVYNKTNDALTIGTARIHSTSTDNVFIGGSSGNFTTTGNSNVAVGTSSMSVITSGHNNTAVGYCALQDVTIGSRNTAIGVLAGANISSAQSNTLIGYAAGIAITSNPGGNVAVGEGSLSALTSGSSNVALGYEALRFVTGNNNIAVGYQAGNNITTGTNNLILGYDIDAPSATANGQLSIQNIIFGTGNTATGTSISTGSVGVGVTSPTRKFEVAGSAAIKAGTSTGQIARVGGVINTNTTTTGNVGTGEDTLFSYSVPANTLSTNNDTLVITSSGTFAASGNNKRIRVKFGATTIYDTGSLPIVSAGDWNIHIEIIRTGAATQKCMILFNQNAGASNELNYATAAETLSGAVTLSVTAEATADNDIVGEMFKVWWEPSE
jgi:hypothetical protein